MMHRKLQGNSKQPGPECAIGTSPLYFWGRGSSQEQGNCRSHAVMQYPDWPCAGSPPGKNVPADFAPPPFLGLVAEQ